MRYQDVNAETIDRWIDEGWEWGKPISHDEFSRAKNGEGRLHELNIKTFIATRAIKK